MSTKTLADRIRRKSDTEPDAEDDDIPDATGAGLRHRSRTADKQTNNRVSTVRVSTTSGSQEAALVRRTPAARGRITPGRAYTPPVLPSSSVARYLSSLATHSATTSELEVRVQPANRVRHTLRTSGRVPSHGEIQREE